MDQFKQISAFVAVATRGSLSAAARLEGVTPALIGRRLDALEARLGVKLLLRTTRKLSLTFEGSAFLEDCQRVLNDLANAEASVRLGGVKASGHLRVSAPAGFGRRHVAPLLMDFLAANPEVTVNLDLSDRIVDLVNEGIDCAVRGVSPAMTRWPPAFCLRPGSAASPCQAIGPSSASTIRRLPRASGPP